MLTHRQRMGEKKTRRESSAAKLQKASRALKEIYASLMDPDLEEVPTDFIAFAEYCSDTARVFDAKAEEFLAPRIEQLDKQYSHGSRIHDAIKRGDKY